MDEKFPCTKTLISRNFVGKDTSVSKVIWDNEGWNVQTHLQSQRNQKRIDCASADLPKHKTHFKGEKKKKVSLGIFAMKTSQSFWKESKIISMTIWLNLLNVVVSLFPKD